MLRFKEWPFKNDETAQIIWINSPYQNDDRQWILPVIFKGEKGKIRKLYTSWGTLPWLRIGQYYSNGQPIETYKRGSIIKLDGIAIEGTYRLADMSKEIRNHFISEKSISAENCCIFMDSGKVGKIVIIPCIEVVRAFFATSKTLANTLLLPYGLDDLISKYNDGESSIHIVLSSQVPKQIINESFIRHLVWIKFNKDINALWNSVYMSLFPRGYYDSVQQSLFENNDLLQAKTIRVSLPRVTRLEVRAIEKSNAILVDEITKISNLETKYDDITYEHPSIVVNYSNRNTDRKNRKRKPTQELTNQLKINEYNKNPKHLSKTVISSVSPTVFNFSEKQEVKRIPRPGTRYYNYRTRESKQELLHKQESKAERRQREIKEYQARIKREQQGGQEDFHQTVSCNEIFFEGNEKIKPLETRGIKVCSDYSVSYLNDFKKMVILMEQMYGNVGIVDIKDGIVPSGKTFSYNNGIPRKYSLATIEYNINNRRFYILEVERDIEQQLSTIIIRPRQKKCFSDDELYLLVDKLLHSLIKKYGHWDKRVLNSNEEARISTVKHLNEWSLMDWAEVIMQRADALL